MPLFLEVRNMAGTAGTPPGSVRLDSGQLVVGRGADAGLSLPSPMVSRQHCIVVGDDAGWQVVDNSSSGTLVNGRRVAGRQPLSHGDIITVADTEVMVSIEGAVSGPLASAADVGMNLDSWTRAASAVPGTSAVSIPFAAPQSAPVADDILRVVLRTAGISRTGISASDAEIAAALGGILRACLAGLGQLANDRRQAREDLGAAPHSTENNPLLAVKDAKDMLVRLLALGPQGAADAVAVAAREIDFHQRATLGAMQGTFASALDHFAPAAIKQRVAGDAAAWKAYEKAFAASDGFAAVFADELRKNYLRMLE